ncbi:hypothetical protein DOE63_02585 [Salmonella enterica subsp. diarizonae serovar 59:z10:-]|nr:hypothetical protein DOE63_02585 [Salmonella enterica subsp. diarizonae serovar 59:z10:-]
MKLAVGNISTSKSHVTGTASIDSNLLWATFPFCSFKVCVDRVDGKSLEQYESELTEKARERITEIYKEIVCGGELDNEIIIPACGKLTGEYGIKVANKNGKLSVAGLVGKDSDMLDLLCNEIKPSKLSHESLAEVDKASTTRDNLEERVALLEKNLEKAGAHTSGVNQECDGSLVMRDADGSVRVRMNAEKQTGLRVTVSDKDDVLWMRDSATLEGIMSLGYLKDGTQQRIIAALEDALFQTKSQLSLPLVEEHFGKNNADMAASIGSKIERRYTEKEIVKIFSISADLLSGWARYRN